MVDRNKGALYYNYIYNAKNIMQPTLPNNEKDFQDRGNVPGGHHTHSHKNVAQVQHSNPAVELIRNKLEEIYQQEPSVENELANKSMPPVQRSKHQQVIYE